MEGDPLGLLDFFARKKALTGTSEVVEALQDRHVNLDYIRLGGTNQSVKAAFQRGQAASYGWMYANQPAVRSVIDYIARNVAQLPLKLYERVSDTERERREDHPAAQTLAWPSPLITGQEFILRLTTDFLIYNNAYALKLRGVDQQLTLLRIPPSGVTVSGGRFRPDFYRIYRVDGTYEDVLPEYICHWFEYSPDDPLLGLSKLETLRRELAGDAATQETITELLKNGLRGGYIKRPLEAPDWGEDGRQRFQEGWTNQSHSSGRHTPVLEEGMEFENTAITPKDAELLSSRQFTEKEVARIYGVPPAVLGLDPTTDPAEQRKQVYADVLPPITKALSCRLDLDILRTEYNETSFYFEFDLNEKLRGDAEARFSAITAAAGRPWLTVNEVRSMENKTPVDGGDALTIPLNVMLEGQGSPALPAPNVMPPQDPNKPPQDGSHRAASEEIRAIENGNRALTNGYKALEPSPEAITAVLRRLYKRAESAAHNGGMDAKRYSRELAEDLRSAAPDANQRLIERKSSELVGVLDVLLKDAKPRRVFAQAQRSAAQMGALLAAELYPDIDGLKALGVPQEILWERAGFDIEEIDRMRSLNLAESLQDAGAG